MPVALPDVLQRHAPLAEQGLRDLFADRAFPLYQLMEYQFGWRAGTGDLLERPVEQPRLYACLCLLACEALGADPAKALPAATAIELVNQFTQVHADIQEGSQERYGQPAVWWVWGPAQAINAGDGLHALARLALLRARAGGPSEATIRQLQVLDDASLRMCEGMYLDIEYQERVDIFPESYLKMAREKVGSLFGCALQLGALAAQADQATCDVLRRYGEEIGVAFQVQEDIQSLWGEPFSGKASGLDVLNKKKGYPVIRALEDAPISQKRELGTLFFKRVLEPADIQQVIAVLERLEAREKAQHAARDIIENAVDQLRQAASQVPALDDLVRAGRWLALRDG